MNDGPLSFTACEASRLKSGKKSALVQILVSPRAISVCQQRSISTGVGDEPRAWSCNRLAVTKAIAKNEAADRAA